MVSVRLTPEGQRRREELLSRGCCLGCGEKIDASEETKRGLHLKCYGAFRRAVKKGVTSERQMVKEGRLLTPNKGRPLSNPLSKTLAEGA